MGKHSGDGMREHTQFGFCTITIMFMRRGNSQLTICTHEHMYGNILVKKHWQKTNCVNTRNVACFFYSGKCVLFLGGEIQTTTKKRPGQKVFPNDLRVV